MATVTKRFRILSIDGGGIRGVIPLVLLQRLVAQLGDFLAGAQLIAGTSTGGLIALGLARGLTLEDLLELYTKKGKLIFDDSWLDDLVDLGGLAGAEYDNKALTKELKASFGAETTLGDLGKRVAVTAFDLDNEDANPRERRWKPKVFHNFPGTDSDAAELAYKVGLYTSAAPTYFPVVDGYIDGGVFANNPSVCALTQALDERGYPAPAQPPALADVRLLSLGTGITPSRIEGKNLDWGKARWMSVILQVLMDGTAGIADFQCRQILGDRGYQRLDVRFRPGDAIGLDDVDAVTKLVEYAKGVDLTSAADWIRRQW